MSNIGGTTGAAIAAVGTIFSIPLHSLTWVTGILSIIGIIVVCILFGWFGDVVERKITKIINGKWHGIGKIQGRG